MSLWGSAKKGWNKYTIFGGGDSIYGQGWKKLTGGGSDVSQESTLTPEQQSYLKSLIGQNEQYLPQTFSTLGSLAYNPQSTYSKMNNWESEFNQGVVNPAMNQMNDQLAASKNMAGLHSSTASYLQNRIRQGTMDSLNQQRYEQLMKERGMQLQSLENMNQNQMSALGALANMSGQALGVQGVQNVVSQNPTVLDYLNTGANIIGAFKK